MRPITEFGNGSHIVRINMGGPDKIIADRNSDIEKQNKILFDKIRGIMERPAYRKEVLFDSKKHSYVALSPIASGSIKGMTLNTDSKVNLVQGSDETSADVTQKNSMATLPE